MANISDLDKKILNRIQSNFPFISRPFKVIALEIGVSEEEVIFCIDRMKKSGIIRRIGGNFVPRKIGFVSTLCAAIVPKDKISLFTSIVNGFSGVTHNYIRDNNFNIWFTFIDKSEENIIKNIAYIRKKTGTKLILNLRAVKVFKIKTEFRV